MNGVNQRGTISRVRINMVLEGELAEFLKDMKRRGAIRMYSDGVMRGQSQLKENKLNRRLLKAHLDASTRTEKHQRLDSSVN